MATKVDGLNVTDKNIDDNIDKKCDQVQPKSTLSSSVQNDPSTSTNSSNIAITTSDPGYKDRHLIGSRKVTENIITYHEPIFQSVVNTIYENQKKTLNMGKRKADNLEMKGEIVSPDVKKKRTESPKIDTGFKVKKKCSIENIIDRIRHEKTQSKCGGVSTSGCSSDETVTQDVHAGNHISTSAPKTGTKSTEAIQTDTLVNYSDVKESLSLKSSYKNTLEKQHNSEFVSCLDNDNVLDLSLKSALKQNMKVSPSDSRKSKKSDSMSSKQNQSLLSKLKPSAISGNKLKTATETSESVLVSTKDKSQGVKKDEVGPGNVKTVLVKDKTKKSDGTLNSMKEKVNQGQGMQSVMKHIGLKSTEKSAIKTNTRKRTNVKVSFTDKWAIKEEKLDSKSGDFSVKRNKQSFKNEMSKKSDLNSKSKQNKVKKQKVPIAFRRVKREASLNAATLVNILYEKNKSPKLNAKRSKSESDLTLSPKKSLLTSKSFTDIVVKDDTIFDQSGECDVLKTPKMEPTSPVKEMSSPKNRLNWSAEISKGREPIIPKKEPESPKKRKVSISDVEFNEIVKQVLKQKPESSKLKHEKRSGNRYNMNKRKSIDENDMENKKELLKTYNKDLGKRPVNSVKLQLAKSPEERAQRKQKANLARLKKANELLIAKKLQHAKEIDEESDSGSNSCSESSDVDTKDENTDGSSNTTVKANKGEQCRAARTHVHVEAKTVFENTSVAQQWCECCQSTYYPSQPQQGTKVWRIKQLVDKGTQNPPELIQSASHHFIAAHASCEVRPYSSPTHVSVLDSGAYVAPLMSHSHVTCTACECRHTGMLHTAQCQGYAVLPCQRYSNTYSVSYPHGHSSYQHCGCGSCCSGGSFHGPSQPLIHKPQIPMSTDTPILVRHTVPLHDTPHPVPLQLSHSDSGRPSCQVPLQINDSNIQQISHCCQLSQGEIIIRTNSQSDQEYIDVGKDDVVKMMPQCSAKTAKSGMPGKVIKDVNNRSVSKERKVSSSNEIKIETSSQTNVQEKDKKKGKGVKLQAQVKEKEKSRKQSDSSQKKQKESRNKDKSGNSKGGKNLKADSNEENEIVEERKVFSAHGWTWEGDGIVKKVINIFDGLPVQRKCFPSIRHEDGEMIHVKDCVLVCSGRKDKDIPYVAKVTNFWEDPATKEMMMTLLWFYRPEHVEGGRRPENQNNEVFAAKHRDESLVACIDDRGFVLTYNEYCRFMGEVLRIRYNLPFRKKVVPDPEEPYPSNRIPPVDVDPENVFLCRHVYDLKLKRVLKNPS